MLRLHMTRIAITLALAGLILPCFANPVFPIDKRQASSPFNCGYRIKPNRTYAEAIYSYREETTKKFADCIGLCDADPNCVAARFNPRADQGFMNPICLLSEQLGFAVTPTMDDPDSDFAALVPRSCKKPVATPTATACKPGTITAPKSGCKYNVTCDVELDPSTSAFIDMVETPEECAHEMFRSKQAFGYTFFQGGACFVGISFEYMNVNTTKRNRAETAQIIEGSCKRAKPPPPT